MTDIGRAGMVMKGDYNSALTYETLDAVSYNNALYVAKQNVPAGTTPPNATYWQLAIDSQGLQPKNLDTPLTIGGYQRTTVEAALGALANVSDYGSAVDLTQYSFDNYYTIPSDGYINLQLDYNGTSGDYATCYVLGVLRNKLLDATVNYTGKNERQLIFVKKGLLAYGSVVGEASKIKYYPMA